MKKTFIFTGLLALALMAGCNSGNDDAKNLTAHEWHLYEVVFDGNDFTETPPADVTISFADSASRVFGNGGCNGYFSTYTLKDDNGISLGEIASTLMACPNLDFEGRYFQWLHDVDSYQATRDELKLKSTAQGATLIYKPAFKAAE